MTRKLWCLAGPAFLLVVASPNTANAGRIDAMERAAKKACLTGDPNKGVAILADLFINTDDPTYIYNQGRCLEQNSRYEDAITKFREYLRKKANGTAEEKADAEKHIVDCQALVGKKSEPSTPPVVAPPPPPATPPPTTIVAPEPKAPAPEREPMPLAPKPAETPGDPVIGVEAAAPSSGEGRGLRVGGIATASVGALALAGGLVANLHHNSLIDELQAKYEPSKDDTAKTYRTLAIVGYGVGAACLVAGSVLYYLGWRAGNVSVVPVAVAGGAAAVMTGAF
jgi:hypothetical protein